jgi:peptidoglycan hydrolase-like protein with peptidoglycan-binding domain
LIAAGTKLKVTGVYDSKTVAAVKAYRKSRKLSAYATTESSVWSQLKHGKTAS